MRARKEGLTASGLLIARETDAVDTPARAATARIPCFNDPMAGALIRFVYVTLHFRAEKRPAAFQRSCGIFGRLSILLTSKRWRLGCKRFQKMLPNRQSKPGQGGI